VFFFVQVRAAEQAALRARDEHGAELKALLASHEVSLAAMDDALAARDEAISQTQDEVEAAKERTHEQEQVTAAVQRKLKETLRDFHLVKEVRAKLCYSCC
jgi:septal ring factor EnvC (AmiA/AmiB activator)